MSPCDRIRLHVSAARKANRLAVRFTRRGDFFNALQARVIALRAIRTARDIKFGV